MNPRAPIEVVHFGDVPLSKVLDIKGFNLNAKLDIDPEFLMDDHNAHSHCDHDHGHCAHDHHHHHDDDVKSFIYKADRPFDPARLEDFLGAVVQVHGPKMLRYKGVLNMKGTERKVIFQGVHQIMGSDLGPAWKPDEPRQSKMVFIGIDLPRNILEEGLEKALA
jgi:G3E family GTPase